MIYLIIVLLVFALIFAPQWWAKSTFERYSENQTHIPGTGGELARHLLDKHDMPHVKVEITESGDHYDPEDKMVRLSASNFNDHSLTAIAVAAHEVGHAIQDHNNEAKLTLRTKLVTISQRASKFGSGVMLIMPIVLILTRSPGAGLIFALVGLTSIAGSAIVHLVTLPVEWDASFGKALPILKSGYIQDDDIAAVDKILKAAALTYVAASLMSILNVWRWVALLRR
ncbi:MAG: zinc metallopeptidase [Cocleimonas sp.]|nr:zinc metallopeptidase [Cocleimonas sp.]